MLSLLADNAKYETTSTILLTLTTGSDCQEKLWDSRFTCDKRVLDELIPLVKYNYEEIKHPDEVEEINLDAFLDKYKNKLNNLILKAKNDKFMKGWKVVKKYIFSDDLINKTINLNPEDEYLETAGSTKYR